MTSLITYSRTVLPRALMQRTILLIILWLLAMISLPISKWIWGPAARPLALTMGVALQTAAVFSVLAQAWGWRRALRTFFIVGSLSLLVEMVGSATGFPFGGYAYTGELQPQVGHVPLLIPLAWFMMLPTAWAVAARWRRRWLFVPLSALALTAWDLMLDPQMVAWNLWQWDNPVGFFGIPWSNYAGWLLTAALLTLLARPRPLPVRPLLVIYTLTWFLETFGLIFFWGLAGPGLVGGGVMGFFVWLGWWSHLKTAVPSERRSLRQIMHAAVSKPE